MENKIKMSVQSEMTGFRHLFASNETLWISSVFKTHWSCSISLESDGVCWLHIQQSVLICFNRKAHLLVLFKLLYILNLNVSRASIVHFSCPSCISIVPVCFTISWSSLCRRCVVTIGATAALRQQSVISLTCGASLPRWSLSLCWPNYLLEGEGITQVGITSCK